MTPLCQQVIDRVTLRGFAAATQKAYLYQLTELANYFHCPPDRLTSSELQQYLLYLLYLIRDRHWSFSSCRQAVHAIRFLFGQVLQRPLSMLQPPHPKKVQQLPDLLYPEEEEPSVGEDNPGGCHCPHCGYRLVICLGEVEHLPESLARAVPG